MSGVRELSKLLGEMKPMHVKGEFVFCTVSRIDPMKHALMTFKEAEGFTIILPKTRADEAGLPYDGIWALVTLTIHSALSAVGLLASVTNTLAKAGIPVNVVSAYYHDHLFVPYTKVEETIRLLENLSSGT